MADAVTTRVILQTPFVIGIHMTSISDGTGETAALKLDKSTLLAQDGAEPAALDLVQVRWNTQGLTNVRLLWDHTTDDVAMVMAGSGEEYFDGPPTTTAISRGALADPRSTGGPGDILLTTIGHVAGSSYDITAWFAKQND